MSQASLSCTRHAQHLLGKATRPAVCPTSDQSWPTLLVQASCCR